MAEFPALPMFTDAYLADTRHLTTLQHGAYLLLLMTAWRTKDCSLPNDDTFLARVTGMDKRTWLANKHVILAFWSSNFAGHLEQKRLKDERNFAEDVRARQSAKGLASAKAKSLKRLNRDSTVVDTEQQPDGNQNSTPSPSPSPSKEKGDINISQKESEFLKIYPRGVRDWSPHGLDDLLSKAGPNDDVLSAVKTYAAECRKTERVGTKFVKSPKAWLADGVWREWLPASTSEASNHNPAMVPVFEGTLQWIAWKKHRKGRIAPSDVRIEGQPIRQGWWFPSEWPPGHEGNHKTMMKEANLET